MIFGIKSKEKSFFLLFNLILKKKLFRVKSVLTLRDTVLTEGCVSLNSNREHGFQMQEFQLAQCSAEQRPPISLTKLM